MKIAVVAVGTRGDVEPLMALCGGLRAAGYQARLVAPLDFEQQAAHLDFHRIHVSFRALYDTPAAAELLASGKSVTFLVKLGRLAIPIAQQIVADINEACAGVDAVCFSPLAFPAYYAARDRGIPCFPAMLQPLGRTREYPSPVFPLRMRTPGFVNRFSYLLMEQVFWQMFRPLMNAKRTRPAPVFGHFRDMYQSGRPALFAYSPSVVPKPADWNASMHVTGYWRMPREGNWQPPEHVAEFLVRGEPPVCIGFGSMHDPKIEKILDASLEAVAELGLRAMVLTGWSGIAKDRLAYRGKVCVTEAIPHEWLFPRVLAVIGHGGAGSTAAALTAGKPSVVMPFFFDQSFWGHWLAGRGFGPEPIPYRKLSAGAIRKALEHAAGNQPMQGRLRELSQKLRSEDGVGNAVGILSQALDGRARTNASSGLTSLRPTASERT